MSLFRCVGASVVCAAVEEGEEEGAVVVRRHSGDMGGWELTVIAGSGPGEAAG